MDIKISICENNENYLIIDKNSLIYNYHLCLLELDRNKINKNLIEALSKIMTCISVYERNERKNGNLYRRVDEVAIEKNSTLGKLIINELTSPEFITIECLTHALLKCIEYEEWDYYDMLTFIIKKLKKNNTIFKFEYAWFKHTFGEDVTNYITNSLYLYPTKSKNKIYLLKNNKITKIELPSKPKTRTKTK